MQRILAWLSDILGVAAHAEFKDSRRRPLTLTTVTKVTKLTIGVGSFFVSSPSATRVPEFESFGNAPVPTPAEEVETMNDER
jgi:hypothetical protein